MKKILSKIKKIPKKIRKKIKKKKNNIDYEKKYNNSLLEIKQLKKEIIKLNKKMDKNELVQQLEYTRNFLKHVIKQRDNLREALKKYERKRQQRAERI